MATEEFNKTPAKANRWFKAFVIFALLYGITFSLVSLFNWIFFFAAAYSLFMSYFLLPQQPKVFQSRSGQSRQFSGGSRPGAQGYTPNEAEGNPVQQQKKANVAVFAGVAAFIFVFVLIGVFSAIFSDDDLPATETFESNTDEETILANTGDNFFNNQQYDSADHYYDLALEKNHDNLTAVYGKGIVLWQKNRQTEAYAWLLRAHEGGFTHTWLSWALGDMYDKQGQTVKAVELYKESIGLDSTFTECYDRLAVLEPANNAKYLQLSAKYKQQGQ